MNLDMVRVEKPKLAYNLEEAAEATGYSVSTLRISMRRNDLIASYANSKPVILADELRDWLKSLPTEPRGGYSPLSQLEDDIPGWPGPPERDPASASAATEQPAKAIFRTLEEAAPEVGVSKSALRQYCKESGIFTLIGKRRIMLHEDDIARLVVWIREQKDKADEWWTDPKDDPFA
ncbi:hypothetical protein SAMN04489740_0831 [Arthrobacter alpinus]|uniref:Helix-turn-helix domain-containing protein n=1 Tax=Arthrobacter alpinus TaxID=656366 RepID=A0A1H5GRI1_9MICC|nr:hypothetical protein [Arthrobacter alpinus]SEE18317.1 hypothetical protein SAMN04489740_0831 [Arthrobacter alpinus]